MADERPDDDEMGIEDAEGNPDVSDAEDLPEVQIDNVVDEPDDDLKEEN